MGDAFPLRWPDGWKRTTTRVDSRFRMKSPAKARDEMIHELELLGATRVIVSTNVPVNASGHAFAEGLGELQADPGVAVYFERNGKKMVIACDRYRRPVENMHALALCVDAMRTQQRHGSPEMLERQFTGFAALPPKMSDRAWWDVLGVKRDAPLAVIRAAYLDGIKRFHTDVTGGNHDVAAQINRAWDEAQKEKHPHG